MVMHARKHPRLNDGYYDRNESHSYKDMDKYPSKTGYNDREYYGKSRDSPSYRRREESPERSPRYHNKASYIERTKETLDRRGASNSPDKKLNSHRSSSDRSDSHYHNYYDRNSRDSRNSKDREARKEKDVRNEIQKTALRVCGEWSEHISSSGKRYYYNCKTEVSQWERPKDWEEDGSKSNETRNKDYEREKDEKYKASDENKHSISDRNERSYRTSSQKQSMGSISSGTKINSRQRISWHESSNNDRSEQTRSNERLRTVDQTQTGYLTSRDHSNNDQSQHNIKNCERTRLSSQNGGSTSSTVGLSQESRREDESEDSKPTEDDMDISPGSTPSSSRPHSRTGTPIVCTTSVTAITSVSATAAMLPRSMPAPLNMLPNMSFAPIASALPQLINRMNDNAALQSNFNHQELTQQALQTLQKLQQALSRQASLAQQSCKLTNQSPRSTDITSPQQQQTPQQLFPSPQQHSHQTPQNLTVNKTADTPTSTKGDDCSRSPTSDHEEPSNEDSPSPGQTNSQGVAVSSLAAAALKSSKSSSVEIAPSLRNYYSERLIGHITGWPSEMYEKQADRYCEESHAMGSLVSTQVSCDLKKARSLVRITNIQSTLQEQRILFLRQQIEELERMKSGNSFMSS